MITTVHEHLPFPTNVANNMFLFPTKSLDVSIFYIILKNFYFIYIYLYLDEQNTYSFFVCTRNELIYTFTYFYIILYFQI